MANSLALKRLLSSNLLPNFLVRPVRTNATVPSASRLFNTNAVRDCEDYDIADERGFNVDRRSGRRNGELNGSINEQSVRLSLQGRRGWVRRGWDAKETESALHLKLEMPGLGKEDVKVSVEHNTLTIKGEGGKERDEVNGKRYSSRIDLPENLYNFEKIKAEMKNGVLKVVVPKIKEDERRDVIQVKVE